MSDDQITVVLDDNNPGAIRPVETERATIPGCKLTHGQAVALLVARPAR